MRLGDFWGLEEKREDENVAWQAWQGAETIVLVHPRTLPRRASVASSKEKSQAAGSTSCAAPEIGPGLSELSPRQEDFCSSLGSDSFGGLFRRWDGTKMFIESH